MRMTKYICPVCGQALDKQDKRYLCKNAHSFDISASGYVNLLRSEKSASRVHGDNKEMIKARRDFLESGAYAPLRDRLCRAMVQYLDKDALILDAGCGEGYYTEKMASCFDKEHIYPIDISKDALIYAGKRHTLGNLAVASVYKLPLGDKSVDGVVSVFSPFAKEEFSRVLTDRGMVFQVIPTARHLFGLKEAIYKTPYENKVDPYEMDGFDFLGKEEVKYTLHLDSQEKINCLFKMTPYYYRTSPADKEKVDRLEELNTDIAFEILIYKKK